MPPPDRRTLVACVCATAVALLASAGARADPELEDAWARRAEPGGLDRAIAAGEAALRAGDADARTFERLVRMRFFRAKERLSGDPAAQLAEYRRCVANGLRGLERHGDPGGAMTLEGVEELDEARERIGLPAIGILYWTALCYGPTIRDASLFKQPGAAKRFRRLVERSLKLDERYFFAGPHRVLAGYLHEAPGIVGGDDDEARSHAEAAMRLYPHYPENPLCRAENVWRPAGDRDHWLSDVDASLSAAEAASPDAAPEHHAAVESARRLKTHVADRF